MREGSGNVKENGPHVAVKTEGNSCEYQCNKDDMELSLRG
jgi:hypothetical protein